MKRKQQAAGYTKQSCSHHFGMLDPVELQVSGDAIQQNKPEQIVGMVAQEDIRIRKGAKMEVYRRDQGKNAQACQQRFF